MCVCTGAGMRVTSNKFDWKRYPEIRERFVHRQSIDRRKRLRRNFTIPSFTKLHRLFAAHIR